MNSLQDHGFFILLSYGVSALLLAAEIAVLWRRSRARRAAHAPHAAKEHP